MGCLNNYRIPVLITVLIVKGFKIIYVAVEEGKCFIAGQVSCFTHFSNCGCRLSGLRICEELMFGAPQRHIYSDF